MSYQIISRNEMRSFIKRAMVAVGTNTSHAETLGIVGYGSKATNFQ
jgi:hypothetical protein